jgi:serine protease Do
MPSDKAGLKEGDIIVAINGKAIHAGDELTNTITTTPVGDTLNITVLRDGRRDSHKVVVGNMAQIFPDQFGSSEPKEESKPQPAPTTMSFGMTIVPLTDRQREGMELKEKGGVRVAEVDPNSFASDLKLFPGNIILSIGYMAKGAPVNQTVSSVEDVQRVQALLKPGDSVKLHIMRRDSPRTPWESTYVAGVVPHTGQ